MDHKNWPEVKRMYVVQVFALSVFIYLAATVSCISQPTIECKLLHMDGDSTQFEIWFQNPNNSQNLLLEKVFVAITYDPSRYGVPDPATAIMNHRFGSQNWVVGSDPLWRALDPTDDDTLRYAESHPVPGQGLVIPKQVSFRLCTVTLKSLVDPPCSPFYVVDQAGDDILTGYVTTNSQDTMRFASTLGIPEPCWPSDIASLQPASASEVQLHPVFPNPVFSGSESTIQFTLPERSRVSLTVQNLLGQEVALIEKGEISEGTFTRSWTPRGLPAGTYVVSMTAEGLQTGAIRTSQQRIQLMK